MQFLSNLAVILSSASILGSCAPAPAPAPAEVTAAVLKRTSCNEDNCYRQMIQNTVQASTFCPTYTKTVSTGTAALPTWVSMCTGNVASRVSSACSCIIPASSTKSTSATTTSAAPTLAANTCNHDNCYRQLAQNPASVLSFCPTYTTAVATGALPTWASMCQGLASRVSSACSCFVPASSTKTSSTSTSSATATATSTCKSPAIRKEWRALKTSEKSAYIAAVKCLTKLPAISGITGTINRYDDFHAVHNNQTPNIHWVGHFILWHRYLTAAYEAALRDECGWTGGQPYWDWSLDVDTKNSSSTAIFETDIFSPTVGFGGNGPYLNATAEQNPFGLTGRTGGGCVQDGPFTYPAFSVNYPDGPKCLTRDFIPIIMNTFAAKKNVDVVMATTDYTSFAKAIENEPDFTIPNIHGSGHFGVGGVLGTIGDAYNSPGGKYFSTIFPEFQLTLINRPSLLPSPL